MKNEPKTSRRNFIKASVVLPTAVAALSGKASAAPAAGKPALPKRKLGKNGPEVTMLNLGGMMSAHSPQYLDVAWSMGIRYFDTADCYIKGESERNIAKWLKRYPERRKELFLVSKDHPKKGPKQLLEQIDNRLKACGTDYLDLFFIHGLGTKSYGKDAVNWPEMDEVREVFEKIKKAGKAKMCGFSCHDKLLVDCLNSAARGGFVDAIMLKYSPFHEKDGAFDRALDACHNKGIGLISMKEMKPFAKAPKKNPKIDEVGLTTHQALLHAVWSDHRIASICSAMENVNQLEENAMAATNFKQDLPSEQREALQQVATVMPVPMCPGCSGCERWAHKTEYAFQDISRYVTYYEQDGDGEAYKLFRDLDTPSRETVGVDLAAIREDCQFKVDYAEIAKRAEQYFA